MKENITPIKTIDAYIAQFPSEVQSVLHELRKVIREAVPDAEEKISYQMPAFYLHGNLVYFAAYKNHIGFYPTASGIEAFKKELSAFKGAKGSVQFPIDQLLPFELIKKIVRYRAKENLNKATEKMQTKKK